MSGDFCFIKAIFFVDTHDKDIKIIDTLYAKSVLKREDYEE